MPPPSKKKPRATPKYTPLTGTTRVSSTRNNSDRFKAWRELHPLYSILTPAERRAETKAAAALKPAARAGDAAAQIDLSGHLMKLARDRRDLKQALDWLKRAADTGSLLAMERIGDWHEHIVGPHSTTSTKWYRKAARLGHIDAQLKLAEKYLWGDGAQKNGKRALEWVLKAAHSGCVSAQFQAGLMLSIGLGVPKNLDLGLPWLHKASAQNHEPATFVLNNTNFHDTPTTKKRKPK